MISQEKQKAAVARGDLGTLFADPTLNASYVEEGTGEVKPIFTHVEENGTIVVTCTLCNLKTIGKYNLDTHRGGKKHKKSLETFEMSSKHDHFQIKYLLFLLPFSRNLL